MVWVAAGESRIGSDSHYAEEGPARTVATAGFWIDRYEVTNAQFAAFVAATGYRSVAESDTASGGAVFSPAPGIADMTDIRSWWRHDPHATWRTPRGQQTSSAAAPHYPVVQVAYADALAYARWRGRDLPTEVEWERAARGSLADAVFPWGDMARPEGAFLANYWQGPFPSRDTGEDGYSGIAPVGCYAPNGFGLYDVVGNVWEWTRDEWIDRDGPRPGFQVIKGGSFLCSDRYCLRYRPAARQPADAALGTEHIGFRTVARDDPPSSPGHMPDESPITR